VNVDSVKISGFVDLNRGLAGCAFVDIQILIHDII
jgi:hypothetical protein